MWGAVSPRRLCLLWIHSLIVTHHSGNQATPSFSQSFKVSVQDKRCSQVHPVTMPENNVVYCRGSRHYMQLYEGIS